MSWESEQWWSQYVLTKKRNKRIVGPYRKFQDIITIKLMLQAVYIHRVLKHPIDIIRSFSSWLRPDMTEKLLTGTLSLNTTNQPTVHFTLCKFASNRNLMWKCVSAYLLFWHGLVFHKSRVGKHLRIEMSMVSHPSRIGHVSYSNLPNSEHIF